MCFYQSYILTLGVSHNCDRHNFQEGVTVADSILDLTGITGHEYETTDYKELLDAMAADSAAQTNNQAPEQYTASNTNRP